MKAIIKKIDGNIIEFVEEGHPEIQKAELADYVLDFARLGEAEITVSEGVVTFCTIGVNAPKDSKPEGSKPKSPAKKTGKWEDDMVTFETLLTKAHELKAKFSIKTEMLAIDLEKKYALFKARVIVSNGEIIDNERAFNVFEGHGDATETNVTGEFIKPHFIRMAETRAIVRALRWYTNNGCAEEEK